MKTPVAAFSLLLLSVCALAQTDFESFLSTVRCSRVELNYRYEVASGSQMKVNGTGRLVLEGNCYKAIGNGTRFICDGSTLWTVDDDAKEVYIENSQGTEAFLTDTETGKSRVSDFSMKGDKASGKYLDAGSGNMLDFRLSEIKLTTPGTNNMEEFRLDVSKLDKTWVITDLRQ